MRRAIAGHLGGICPFPAIDCFPFVFWKKTFLTTPAYPAEGQPSPRRSSFSFVRTELKFMLDAKWCKGIWCAKHDSVATKIVIHSASVQKS